MTTSNDAPWDASAALAARTAYLAQFEKASLAELEALRPRMESGPQRDDLDAAILSRRRVRKAFLESLTTLADLFDKAALPAAAAIPVFLTFLATEKLLVERWRSTVLVVGYMVGAILWLFCRWKAYQLTNEAKLGAAELGKVD